MARFDGTPTRPLSAPISEDDADIIGEARDRWQMCMDAENRSDAKEDLRFLRGEQWDAEAAQNRDLDNRPMLTINNVPAIIHQVTNDVRQNKQSIQVHPVDDGADPEVAKVIEGLCRHVEYQSGADAAYDTALDGAAQIGFGYFRLISEYSGPMSFDQDLKIKRIRNHFSVVTDPNAQEADASDMQFAFISSRMLKKSFELEHPNATATPMAWGALDGENDWFMKDYIRIAEYYRIELKKRQICMLGSGKVVFKEDVPEGEEPVQTRTTQIPTVMWYKMTGAEILTRSEVPCPWIPVFPVYGDEIDTDGKVERWGLIRNLKSPKMMENYWLTAATEEIALRTKTPFIGALGQFEGVEKDWNAANTRNFSYLEYNPVVVSAEDGQSFMAPPPQRQAPADVPSGYIAMAQIAGDKVKAVTGIYDASLGNRSNETSGLAIRARQAQGDIANFHFTDNLTRAITHLGRCMVAMIPHIYDTQRVIRILGEDRKTADRVEINKPATVQDDQGNAIDTVLNDLTVGTYDVVVTTGPAYNTLRQEAAANLVELGGKFPALMEVAGDKIVRALDFPGADEIADRLEKILPAAVREDDDKPQMVQTPKGPIPIEQAGQLIGQLDHTLEQMQGEFEELQSGVAKARIDADARVEVARINAEAKHADTELSGAVQLMLARLDQQGQLLASMAEHRMGIEKAGAMAEIEHAGAVAAAGDPDHPAAPAPIAQGLEEPPAQVSARESEAAADTGDGLTSPAPDGE
jgi:hypothetical protein